MLRRTAARGSEGLAANWADVLVRLRRLTMGFWRDDSGRLTFDLPGVTAMDFPAVCRDFADALGLASDGDIIVGPDQMFWDFRRVDHKVGLDWDIWMEFMVVAKSEASEPLLQDIAAWLESSRWAEASRHE
jgi:hypothetical protein